MSDRAVLSCPHCGAPLPRASADAEATCRFCGVTSLPVAAARPHVDGGATAQPCPRCGDGLFEGKVAGATLLGCGRCGGIWLDNASAQRVLATRDAAVTELAGRADARANATAAPRLLHPKCPVCARGLDQTVDHRSRVELDVCPSHGTFFDRFELGLVMRAWGKTPAELSQARARSGPAVVPDFRRSDWGGGDVVPGAIVAAGAFAIVGSLLALGSDA